MKINQISKHISNKAKNRSEFPYLNSQEIYIISRLSQCCDFHVQKKVVNSIKEVIVKSKINGIMKRKLKIVNQIKCKRFGLVYLMPSV